VDAWGSYACLVSEVSVSKEGALRVHRAVCAVDCGLAVNPDGVEAQMQGGIVFGLTAALYGRLTFEGGRVLQSNFMITSLCA
jgi:CO/xanthine dehydrogenase Mo-binding subunit